MSSHPSQSLTDRFGPAIVYSIWGAGFALVIGVIQKIATGDSSILGAFGVAAFFVAALLEKAWTFLTANLWLPCLIFGYLILRTAGEVLEAIGRLQEDVQTIRDEIVASRGSCVWEYEGHVELKTILGNTVDFKRKDSA